MGTTSTLHPGAYLQGGKYRILRPLGQGGFGITYEAEQVALHRKVAVKEFFMKEYCERDGGTSHVTLGTSSGSKELVEKFRGKFVREAQMIAGFSHPHIVRIHDVFEENGTAYYVMEYLEGGSLMGKVQHGEPLPEAEAVTYIREVGSALEYIHQRNCLHFDVKPSNVMLDADGRTVLIDFGVSKHYDEGGHQTSSTPVGISKGYAPLEQYQQTEISTFTPATDIYSLGATLYFLLTGAVPPGASEVNEDGLPPMPSTLSAPVRRAVEKAMQPRRKDRPQSVAAFLQLLDVEDRHVGEDDEGEETVVAGGAIRDKALKPSPGPALSPSPKPSRKGLWIALASGVAALALVLLLIPGWSGSPGPSGGHEWTDLGLSVKWATCNVGASSPSDYGDYYAWGEMSTKSEYEWKNYKFRASGDSYENVTFSKYNTKAERGTIDNKKSLDLSDDAAHSNWGGKWRMPTDVEWTELREKCKWTWTSQGGTDGYKVTGPNGNSIFLPAAGYRNGTSIYDAGSNGRYWSSSLSASYPEGAWNIRFHLEEVGKGSYVRRHLGLSVRPVSE